MTKEDVDHFTAEIKDALKSKDVDRIRCAQARITISMMDCQQKTAERVKKVVEVVDKIDGEHKAMYKSHLQYQTELIERRGAEKLLKAIKYITIIGSSGGIGAAIMKALSQAM